MVRGRMVIAAAPARGCIALAAVASASCHVVVQNEIARPVATERIAHPEGAIARRPTLILAEAGRLRFIEPLECPTEEIVRQELTTELASRPNLATFTVGVIAAAVGGVMLTTGLFSKEPGTSPYTYIGIAGAGVGLPFAIGPWVGNGTELRPHAGEPPSVVRRPGPTQPCGDRPLAARSATLETAGLEVQGAIDREGWFSISPYLWIDAFDAASATPSAVTATVEGDGGRRTVTGVLEAAMLAKHAASFLARADFDAKIEPLKLVPGISAGALRASLVNAEQGPALRVVLPLRNDGPGDAWALRGQIAAPTTPAIDGRMIYIGHLAKGAAIARELDIPLSRTAAAALRNKALELSVELRDAYGTAPGTPVRFRGTLTDAR
ncbi:MAG TPA: hypothetical protein VGD80_06825 [Kofleriaceae bacterium]